MKHNETPMLHSDTGSNQNNNMQCKYNSRSNKCYIELNTIQQQEV